MRRQAAWGIFLCLLLLGFVFYTTQPAQLADSPPFAASLLLIALIVLILLIALISHPRRAGCRFFATLVTLSALAGLFLNGRHSWVQTQTDASLAACTTSHHWADILITLPQQLVALTAGISHCRDAVTLYNLPLHYWLCLIFLILSFFGLYLLFMRIDRPIFR